jgi:hypothetical protein
MLPCGAIGRGSTMNDQHEQPRFTIPMPGGRAARVPISVLEQFVVAEARCTHASLGDEDSAVSAHHLSVDAAVGTQDWHTDWEFGECEYVDEAGFPQRKQCYHRHPFGTDYAELYEGR